PKRAKTEPSKPATSSRTVWLVLLVAVLGLGAYWLIRQNAEPPPPAAPPPVANDTTELAPPDATLEPGAEATAGAPEESGDTELPDPEANDAQPAPSELDTVQPSASPPTGR